MTDWPPPAVSRRLSGKAGFTLIEALIAFVVLALVTVTLQRGVLESRAGLARAGARLGSDSVLRTIMTGPLGTDALTAGRSNGTLHGFDWTMTVEPLSLPSMPEVPPGANAVWVPVRVRIDVSGRATNRSIEVVRLVKAG